MAVLQLSLQQLFLHASSAVYIMLITILFLIQLSIYALLNWSLSKLLSRIGALSNVAIFLGSLVIGLASGLLTTWLWPRLDSIAYPNVAAMLWGATLHLGHTVRPPWNTISTHCHPLAPANAADLPLHVGSIVRPCGFGNPGYYQSEIIVRSLAESCSRIGPIQIRDSSKQMDDIVWRLAEGGII